MAKTIYRVEGTPAGEAPRDPSFPNPDLLPDGETSDIDLRVATPEAKRRKLFWILIGIAILTVAMIAAIAALGAAESPAVGTAVDQASSTTAPVSNTQPVATTVSEAPSPTTSETPTTAGTTATTVLSHAIADPARLVIPALDVDAEMVPVGLTNGTEMEVPPVGKVGWYKLGPVPGASGASVLVSQVSWDGEKGVFYKLKDLESGDEFEVYGSSGDHALFQVDSSETILKANLPTERIWNETDQAVIRLVTSGGKYDSKTGLYLSNVIVYGHLVK